MASVNFSVIVLVLLQQVYTAYSDCSNIDNLKNCNECIRCGGHWCNDPNESQRCTLQAFDSWCLSRQEPLKFLDAIDEDGSYFEPKYRMKTLKIGMEDKFKITYSSKINNPKVVLVVNSTQTSNFRVYNKTNCYDGNCETNIEVNPTDNFCTATGTSSEYFNVKMSVEGIEEEAVMKYHVPCACGCSEKVEEHSPLCNRRGNNSCGVCTCDNGWTGTFCDKPICESKRGDVPCTDNVRNNMECSGNGVCGPCDKCECFTDKEGSQYFDKDNFCADICSTTSDCDDCFLNPRPGRCQTCPFDMYRQNYNETLMKKRDEHNRQVWIKCNVTVGECNYVYATMRDNRDTFFMVIDACDPVTERQEGAVSVTLPIVLGVLAVVAAAMATAGYMMWKNRSIPVTPSDPTYQNIVAEECTGENPLYKPPTSSFKNPMYGKC